MTDRVQDIRISDDEVAFYRHEGYLLVPGLVSDAAVEELRHDVMDIMEQIGLGTTKLRQTGQYLGGTALDRLVNSPNLLHLAEQLMEGPSTLHSPFTAVKSPGGGAFHYHQDNQYTQFDGPGINLWIALVDMTPENGCLCVAPRIHLDCTLEQVPNPDGDGYHTIAETPEHILPVRMRAGDCCAFNRLTIHASGPNETSEPRVAYAIQYFRNDTKALRADGEWRLLKEHPVIDARPVEEIDPA